MSRPRVVRCVVHGFVRHPCRRCDIAFRTRITLAVAALAILCAAGFFAIVGGG